MGKRIVICCDGTWNTPDEKEGDALSTNVVKIAHAVRPLDDNEVHQVVYYDRGVGTNWGLDRVAGGAFGIGLSHNIEDAYRFLVDNYVDGDELFFFGFSRGAYTVRSLAGLIRNCGLLKKVYSDKFYSAYEIYRSREEEDKKDSDKSEEFIERYSRKIEKIKFIGVWDTVGSLGIPGVFNFIDKKAHEFHDVTLSRMVENAYHALAIDERRQPFEPTLWEQREDAVDQTLEQVWFVGVHSNIGGGYADCGLSDIAFTWMANKARSCDLALDQEYIDKHIAPNVRGVLRDSLSLFYRMFGKGNRTIPASKKKTNEKVHKSAIERLGIPEMNYRTKNLLAYRESAGFEVAEE